MSQKIRTSVEIDGSLTASQIANATTDTDKFLVSDGGTVKYRTGAEMLSDLGVSLGTASKLQHQVKAEVSMFKGQAVYVTGADGTNMIVGLASCLAESTSSKTMGLINANVAANGFADVITEGLLSGLNTSSAEPGDPVWLGTNGNLRFGLSTKPSAPNHLVFIGIVTRVNANNGEIFVKVQNGFELDELHDVDLKSSAPVNNQILAFEGAPLNLWRNKTIPTVLGYTPANDSNVVHKTGNETISGVKTFSSAIVLNSSLNIVSGNYSILYNPGDTGYWQNYVDSSNVYNFGYNGTYIKAKLDVSGNFTANSFTKSGGTSSQFLKADGSVDSNSYYLASNPNGYISSYTETDTLSSVTGRGASTSNQITLSGGGDNSNTYSSLRFSGYNQGGGVGYHGFFEIENTYSSGTNKKKFFRLDSSGTIQIINSAYTANIFNLTDAGDLTVNKIIKSGGTSSQYLMADGSVSTGVSGGVTSFNTRTGTVTLTSGDVTTALGYTPYNSSNPNGYISSYTETDTLASVTGRGATTNTLSTFDGGLNIGSAKLRWGGATTPTLGLPFSGSTNAFWIDVNDGDTGGLMVDNEGVTVYGAGDNGYVFRVIDEDVYQATSNVASSTTFQVSQGQNGGGFIKGNFDISGTLTASGYNKTNWDTAYGWGNHASAGYALSGHTHDLGRYSLRAPALIDSVTASNFRTQLFGSSTSGYNISTARFNATPGLLSGLNNYGTMMAWSGSDTHGFLAIDYAGPAAIIGGGNADNINWTKRLAFLDDTVPNNRTITINGTSYDLSANRSWTVTASETDTLATVVARGDITNGGRPIRLDTSGGGVSIRGSAGGWATGYYFMGGTSNTYRGGFGALGDNDNLTNYWIGPAYNNYYSFIDSSQLYHTNSVRSPIFYDSNNTGYYVDPASTSSLNVLSMANKIIVGSFPNSTVNNGEAWIGRAADRSAGTMTVQLGGNLDRKFEVVDYGWTTVNFSVNGYGAAEASGSMRAPIFYDSNDTSYYLDPNSTSRLLAVNAPSGFTSVGNPWGTANSAYFPNGITTAGSDNWIYGHTYVGNAPANGAGHEFWSTGKEYHRSNEATNGHGASGRWLSIQSANGNFIPYSFESEYGNHSWGTVARFRINQSGADRPSIQFSNATNDTRWNVGYCYVDDNFRIVQNMGYRNDNSTSDGWGTERLLLDTAGNFYSNGLFQSNASLRSPIYYDSNNTGYYVDPASSSSLNTANIGVLTFRGVGGDSGVGSIGDMYGIYQQGGSWTYPYPDLCIGYHTGIKIGAYYSYNGTRFYNNSDWATITASVNDGDNNFRGYYDVIAYASDRRLKHKVKPIEDALSKVKSLTGMTYQWNEIGKDHGWDPDTEVREAGVFAQDVQAVLPEAVRLAPFDDEHGVSRSGENFLTVKYDKIVPLLIEAIKEQQAQIEELKELVNKLINK